MRPIEMTKEISDAMILNIFKQFREMVKLYPTYASKSGKSTKITIDCNFDIPITEKVKLIYTPEAWIRMKSLVAHFSTEVAWYGVVDKIDKRTFRIRDVKICKQIVTGVKVDSEDADTNEFYDSLTDDEVNHLHFQGHSHVNMGTTPSEVDVRNQLDMVANLGGTGFFIFQVWNKKDSITTVLYDLDENVIYDSDDVKMIVEDSMGSITDWVDYADKLVVTKKPTTYSSWANGRVYDKDLQAYVDKEDHNGCTGYNQSGYLN